MEDFYRWQRVRLGVLVDEQGRPAGGRWNFDRQNRRPPTRAPRAPDPWRPEEDEVDEEVRRDLDALDVALWGEDGPRRFAATPQEARRALASFVDDRLAAFGPWQDAMTDERVFFHSLLSAPMNLGLLRPLEVVRAVEAAPAPLQSKEGYIRQVIGWREYVWGMYWLRRDRWPGRNALGGHRDLPAAFWGAHTGWNCLDSVVDGVRRDAYAHHIQRLMVLGNTMLLAGVEPWQGVRWFQGAFIDGAEWVMAPNAAGMAMHADGGEMFTKPYAGRGNYVNRMSRYCPDCRYEPNVRRGPRRLPGDRPVLGLPGPPPGPPGRQPAHAQHGARPRRDGRRGARGAPRARAPRPSRSSTAGELGVKTIAALRIVTRPWPPPWSRTSNPAWRGWWSGPARSATRSGPPSSPSSTSRWSPASRRSPASPSRPPHRHPG
ncbi:MAG: cryptochrome/photolyase family protein, partial [Actinomycetota bacterium]|nr:cryptochrome/photolyase family protein [Actinomycetota bacterium]